jgi:TPR repeat protein
MVSTEALYRIAIAAEEAGNHEFARQSYERGAALGDAFSLFRLAHMYDVGELGVSPDKVRAMQLYKRAWRKGNWWAAPNNIAILYRERGDRRAMFQWFERAAAKGDGSAHLDLAKCFLEGTGVRKNAESALRCLAFAVGSEHISEAEREEAQALLDSLRPRSV